MAIGSRDRSMVEIKAHKVGGRLHVRWSLGKLVDQTMRKKCMKNVLMEVSNENDRKSSEGEGGPRVRENDDNEMKQVTTSNNKLQSSCEN